MKLSGNTILITGGSAGIGLAFAEKFVELKNTVIITGRTQAKLDAAKAAVPSLHCIQCDAGDPAAVKALGAEITANHPETNVLMNNAGIFDYRNLSEANDDLESLTRELNINLAGPIRTVSVLIEQLKAKKGTIINVSSGLAYVPLQAAPIYCATKAGLHSYTITLRQQLKSSGVEVIELLPPATQTELIGDLKGDGSFKIMPLQDMVDSSFKGLRAGHEEIRPGQANQLFWMSRIAPGFINGQLEKGSAELVPKVA